MTPRLRVGLTVGALAALCVPFNRGVAEPAFLLPLARTYAAAAARSLQLLGVTVARDDTVVRLSPSFAIEVGPHCTAWIYLVLWIGALAAAAPGWRRGLRWGLEGATLLAGVNLLRLILIALLGSGSDAAFAWSHGLLGEILLAGTALLLWSRVESRVSLATTGRSGTPRAASAVGANAGRPARALCARTL